MHTSVRAPGTMQVNPLLRYSAQDVYNLALNCRFICLNLPTVEIRSVVGNGELEISHSKAEWSLITTHAQICCRALLQRFPRGRADNLPVRNWQSANQAGPAI